ncbi:MAG TPA: GNAT family N-acetyltransferase [Candidatus Saccharimonadia bacterium]|nr:GNAT family N-acetyltransferase [Candidatus Saccharimonadia bacterium]
MADVMIGQLGEASEAAAEQLGALMQQLTANAQPLDVDRLRTIVEASALYVAKADGRIIGTVCRIDLRHPVRTKCWIEDLVVDSEFRGQGIARRLMEAAIAGAPEEAVSVNLNSNVARTESHRLYQKLGFAVREETRIWLLKLPR